MTRQQAKSDGFTHQATFYGIPCYYEDSNCRLVGTNGIYDLLLDVAIWIESEWPSNDMGFPILVGKEL